MKLQTQIALAAAGLLLGFGLFRLTAPPELRCSLLAQPEDQERVRRHIRQLAWSGERISLGEDATVWLVQHLEESYPDLLDALDDSNERIAERALFVLRSGAARPEFGERLVRIGRSWRHPLRTRVPGLLVQFANIPQARPILANAMNDTVRYPDPLDRAGFAEALHDGQTMVELLLPLLKNKADRSFFPAVEALGRSGHPSARAALEELARRVEWEVAASAYLALDVLDPYRHGLSENQRSLLEKTRRRIFKGGWFPSHTALTELAYGPRDELRPLVTQMLASDAAGQAATILGLWKDRAGLPRLGRLLWTEKRPGLREVVGAFLAVDDSESADDEVVKRAGSCWDQFECEDIILGATTPELPLARRVRLLERIRDRLKEEMWPKVIARVLQDPPLFPRSLVAPLFESEVDIDALGAFCELATREPREKYAGGVRRALQLLSRATLGDPRGKRFNPAAVILDAGTKLEIEDLPRFAAPFLAADEPVVRIAANCAFASQTRQGARDRALQTLHSELRGHKSSQAANCLLELPCVAEDECRHREEALLAMLGTAAEEQALRVLPICAGEKTVVALSPLLESDNLERAGRIALALAQFRDGEIAVKAQHRLALLDLFHARTESQGGVGRRRPRLAPTVRNPSWRFAAATRRAGVQDPGSFPLPNQLDEAEQSFLVRAYRACRRKNPLFDVAGNRFGFLELPGPQANPDWLPFLEVVLREDEYLSWLRLNGRSIAFFPNRAAAAKTIAQLTGKPTSYLAFGGEPRDSSSLPVRPYAKQNRLVAKFIVDKILASGLGGQPQPPVAQAQQGNLDESIARLAKSANDPELQVEILDESRRRGLLEPMKQAGFRVWLEPR